MQNKQLQTINQENPADLVFKLVGELPKRSKDIIIRRFGLDGRPKETLDKIGKSYGITRERVRQIESSILKDFRDSGKLAYIKPLEESLKQILEEHGKIMERRALIDTFIKRLPDSVDFNIIEFVLELSNKFKEYRETEEIRQAWAVKGTSLKLSGKVFSVLYEILENKSRPLSAEDIISALKKHQDIPEIDDQVEGKVIISYLRLTKKVRKNPFGEWGLSSWSEISPQGVKDKAYVVLQKQRKPLHFTKITNLINEVGFDGRIAQPQTVHNELIKDGRFVLVGRGTYALTSWGYEPGTVAQIIEKVLKRADSPLSREEIVNQVLKQRMVRKNTVILALQDKNRFKRVGKKYKLVIG